jgi:hypothetical protein
MPVVKGLRARNPMRVVEAQQPRPVYVMQCERDLMPWGLPLVTSFSAIRNRMLQPFANQYRRRS